MKPMARCFAVILAVVCILCSVIGFSSCEQNDIRLNEDKSFFSDFKIENDKVYLYCTLFVENSSETERTVTLKASFEADVKNGLLKEALTVGYSFAEGAEEFRLQKGENQIDVVFIGEHAGGDQKHDRRLPDIMIEELE